MSAITLRELPSADKVRERLDYNQETGIFTWRHCDEMRREWNTRYAGKIAGANNGKGYIKIRIDDRHHFAHRLAWLVMTGECPVDQLDHINGIRDDNRFANLREVCDGENRRNMAMYSTNTSGVTGVSWHKPSGRWVAQIVVNYRAIVIGYFAEKAAAIAARKEAEITYGFHINHGRASE